jgi:hypothetical protein
MRVPKCVIFCCFGIYSVRQILIGIIVLRGMPALFRQALFRQALFRQALFRQPLFRQALLVVNPLGERAITIRKAWESFGGGSEETSWLTKSLTERVPKDRNIIRKRTIIQVKVTSRSTKKRNTHLRWTV